MKNPEYLVRPADLEIFSLNKDGKTYSLRSSKLKFPNNLHSRYKFNHLSELGFYAIEPTEVRKFVIRQRKEDILMVRFGNDGHGDEDDESC